MGNILVHQWRMIFALTVLIMVLSCPIRGGFAEEIPVFGNQAKSPKIKREGDVSKGILVDVLKVIEPDMGVTFRIETYPWKRAYSYAANGDGAIVGLSKTEERLKIFDYSDPLYYDEVILVVKKGKEFPFNSFEDLRGKIIGACSGCSFGLEYEEAKTYFTLQEDHTETGRLKKVLVGRLDAAVISPGQFALNQLCLQDPELNFDDFTILSKMLARDPNHLAFIKTMHRQDFLIQFNRVLQEKIRSGEVQNIIDRYSKF